MQLVRFFATAVLLAASAFGSDTTVTYRTVKVNGLDIFYREAGPKTAPTILLLHGFPTSSAMFRNLMPQLATSYHVIAPDYPGYGQSSMPSAKEFEYSFENLTNVVERFTSELKMDRYALYVMDYGAPIGYRLALRHPEKVSALIVQNGNAYEEGLQSEFWNPVKQFWANRNASTEAPLREFLKLSGTKWQYTNGVSDLSRLNPEAWTLDQRGLDRPGNVEIQLDLFHTYATNAPLYGKFQEFFRKYQPPTVIVWGKNDAIFPPAGALPYLRDLPKAEVHLYDTGHFALETHGEEIGRTILEFLGRNLR